MEEKVEFIFVGPSGGSDGFETIITDKKKKAAYCSAECNMAKCEENQIVYIAWYSFKVWERFCLRHWIKYINRNCANKEKVLSATKKLFEINPILLLELEE